MSIHINRVQLPYFYEEKVLKLLKQVRYVRVKTNRRFLIKVDITNFFGFKKYTVTVYDNSYVRIIGSSRYHDDMIMVAGYIENIDKTASITVTVEYE